MKLAFSQIINLIFFGLNSIKRGNHFGTGAKAFSAVTFYLFSTLLFSLPETGLQKISLEAVVEHGFRVRIIR